ncbi:ROK family transcriptional regulator [Microlunatus sp. Gsoil 973]|uniref:ROK family transcriptional regulator n=1 Tax=Microlunatus sp. Gsoil 973 TaxID=2672569 RepID=UPI0018A82DD6|nr:ROK family transcriptional regulator [Microlunatus sp. Gsoil 973]
MSASTSTRKAASQGRIADYNQTVILDAVRRSIDGVSRVELAAATGLSAQAVTNIVRQLMAAGLITEGRRAPIARGKPRTLLHLNPQGQYAIGVHLDPAVITYVILNLVGETLAHARYTTPAHPDPDEVTASSAARIEELITEAEISRDKIVGLGIAAPGPIDVDRGVIVDPPNLEGWQDVPLRDALRDAVGLPVLLDKDVTAAAAAEKWYGGVGNFLFFYLGTGVGAGLVINNEVFRGPTHNSGQIGNMIIANEGIPCPCGYRGCLGESSQPRMLVHLGVTNGGLDHDVDLDDRPQVEAALVELADRALHGNEAAREVLDTMVRGVLKACEDIALLLDLDHVVFGGPHWTTLSPFFSTQRLAEFRRRHGIAVDPPVDDLRNQDRRGCRRRRSGQPRSRPYVLDQPGRTVGQLIPPDPTTRRPCTATHQPGSILYFFPNSASRSTPRSAIPTSRRCSPG